MEQKYTLLDLIESSGRWYGGIAPEIKCKVTAEDISKINHDIKLVFGMLSRVKMKSEN